MKTVIAIVALFAVAFVVSDNDMSSVVRKEVKTLFNKNPNITETDCQQQCDDIFDMLVPGDEKQSDGLCKKTCHCFLNKKDCRHSGHKQGGHKKGGHKQGGHKKGGRPGNKKGGHKKGGRPGNRKGFGHGKSRNHTRNHHG